MYTDQVRFKPWIGKSYGEVSTWGAPFLILGESHYDREGIHTSRDFTIELIKHYVGGYKFANWNPSFLTKILNTVVGSQGSPALDDKRMFWESVAFYNYIQEFVGDNHSQAPVERMWNSAQVPFEEILETLKPACILVISERLWNNMPASDHASEAVSANGKSTQTRIYGTALAGRIHHPSTTRGFRPLDWHPLVAKLLNMSQFTKMGMGDEESGGKNDGANKSV